MWYNISILFEKKLKIPKSKYAEICKNMQKYLEICRNMQKYAKISRNM